MTSSVQPRDARFGNGQFACLILCLTITDLVTTVSGLVGGLVLEAGDMTWAGSSQGCAAYYFISSWLLGLSNYLVVCLVCLLLVKRSPGFLARLHVSPPSVPSIHHSDLVSLPPGV